MAGVRIYKTDRFSYAIENKAFPLGKRLESFDEIRAYVKAVTSSEWWKERCALPTVSVLSTRAQNYSYSSATVAAIYVSGRGWWEQVILHELCHQFVDSRHGYCRHNEKFMYWLFRFNKEFNTAFRESHQWDRADELYLEAGINVGANDELIEGENKGRVRMIVKEEGPIWRSQSAVSWNTHIPVPELHRLVVRKGYTVSSMVRAMGGDKGLKEPLAEYWRPVYAGRSRWVSRECLSHLDDLTRSKQ